MKKKIFSVGNKVGNKTFDILFFEKYVKENQEELLNQIICGFPSREYINTIDVSNSQEHEIINIMSLDENEVNGVKFENIDLNMPFPYKVNMSLCPYELLQKFNFYLSLNKVKNGEDFVKYIVKEIVTKIQYGIEHIIWSEEQRCSESKVGGKICESIDGFLTLANKNEQTIKVHKGTNDWETLINVIQNIPDDIKDIVELFCGSDMYRNIALYIKDHKLMREIDIIEAGDTIIVPGTAFKLHNIQGLTKTNQIIATEPYNLIYIMGYDEATSDDKQNVFKMYYYEPKTEYRIECNIRINAQIVFPDQVVVSEK